MKRLNKPIFTIHFLFWAVYFCFFLYQINPIWHEGSTHFKPKMMLFPPQINPILPPSPPPDFDALHHEHSVEFSPREHTTIVIDAIVHVLMMLILAYTNYFYLLPRLLQGKSNKKMYFFNVSLLFIASVVILLGLKSLINHEFLDFEKAIFFKTSFIFELSLSALFILLFVSLLKFLENYVEVETEKKDIENERLRAELAQLKSQINPHFLFNAFNNLYALSLQNSDKTPQTIEKLSQIMRYSLYESSKTEVALSKEIALIENILDMERLHLGTSGTIIFDKNIDTVENALIAPMILVTFLENAFKHGAKGAKTWIEISLFYQNKTLQYRIKNRKETDNSLLEKSGIGLKNVQRQLALSYPNQHEFRIEESDEFYIINLIINNL